MKGSDFVAVRRLTNKAGEVLAAVGATCERVPEASLAALEARGAIRRAEGQPATADPQSRRGRRRAPAVEGAPEEEG